MPEGNIFIEGVMLAELRCDVVTGEMFVEGMMFIQVHSTSCNRDVRKGYDIRTRCDVRRGCGVR